MSSNRTARASAHTMRTIAVASNRPRASAIIVDQLLVATATNLTFAGVRRESDSKLRAHSYLVYAPPVACSIHSTL